MTADRMHGIDPAVIEQMKAPVLVRIMPQEKVTTGFVKRSNVDQVMARSPVEIALEDAPKIRENISTYHFDESGKPSEDTVRQFTIDIGEPNALARMFNSDGDVTPEAESRIRAAAFQEAYRNERLTGPDEIPWIPHFARQETRDVAGTASQGIGQEGRVGFVVAGLGLVAGDRRRIGNQQVPASLFEQIVHPVHVVGGLDDGDVLLSLTEPRHEIDVLLLPFPKSDAAGSHDLAVARAIFPDLVDHYRDVDVVAVQVLSDEVNRVVKVGVVGLNGLKGVSIHESLPLMLTRKKTIIRRGFLCVCC